MNQSIQISTIGPQSDVMNQSIQISTIGPQSDVMIVSIRGSLDTVLAYHLQEKIETLIESGIFKYIMNLEELEYLSSAGIGLFSGIALKLRKYERKIVFINVPDQVIQLLQVTRLIKMFTIAKNVEHAMLLLEADDFIS